MGPKKVSVVSNQLIVEFGVRLIVWVALVWLEREFRADAPRRSALLTSIQIEHPATYSIYT